MDLAFTAEERAFQEEVRSFLRDNLPDDIRSKVENGKEVEKDDYVRWQRILNDRGWLVPNWPEEYGGPGWTAAQKYIFATELGAIPAPRLIPFGTSMVGPVIYTFGNEEQKNYYLPRILTTEDWWCQGYSEPGAGSDLASLKTRAVRDGDHYVVNGSKTWTTLAQYADMMFCLVRTDPDVKPQQGISFLLIDMNSPGIEVHPIVTIDGGREINQVFLDDVRVPVENLIGEEGKGWTYAKFLLGHERLNIAGVPVSKRKIADLKDIARAEADGAGGALMDDMTFRRKLAETEIKLEALEYAELRMLAAESAGKAPGAEASLLKIRGTEVQQAITELTMEAVGYYANPYVADSFKAGWNEDPIGPDYAGPAAPVYFNWRKSSIYGGSNEIQRNIIAKMVLGL
jgi:alkylation response protein AidB-like acyl-CoA dehydrogenase